MRTGFAVIGVKRRPTLTPLTRISHHFALGLDELCRCKLKFVLPSKLARSGRQPWSDQVSCAASVVLACLGFGLLI